MNDLTSRALELQHAAHELMYLGMDGEPVYSDAFCRLNKEVLVKSDSLFSAQSSDVEEEANLCLALLMGYNATIYDDGDKEQKKQTILNRICHVLEHLPVSLLKVRLLTYCYVEIYEEVLLQEAYAIIEGWNKDNLTSGQTEIIEELKNIEENPYPFEEVE
ncbi:UpxZ family transcription anti-terminator antagonist [Bacteroides uniformis]|uniref:UpxZ family transcription anti-terminator antagonist n=1 Tax=Bacteroides uniformis TaxID=820 RepID=UPI00406CDA27